MAEGVEVRLNPGFETEVRRSQEVRAACVEAGDRVATEAERIGRRVASTYHAEAVETKDGARVQADTGGIGAAGWIEFGTPTLPASAPLRRGAEAAGLKAGR